MFIIPENLEGVFNKSYSEYETNKGLIESLKGELKLVRDELNARSPIQRALDQAGIRLHLKIDPTELLRIQLKYALKKLDHSKSMISALLYLSTGYHNVTGISVVDNNSAIAEDPHGTFRVKCQSVFRGDVFEGIATMPRLYFQKSIMGDGGLCLETRVSGPSIVHIPRGREIEVPVYDGRNMSRFLGATVLDLGNELVGIESNDVCREAQVTNGVEPHFGRLI